MENTNNSDITEQSKYITIVDYVERNKIKRDFIKCVNNILSDGEVEKINLENTDLLKQIFNDNRIQDVFYDGFKDNFSEFYNDDMLMKSQDFAYQLNLFINNSLIPYYQCENVDFLVEKTKDLCMNNDLDLYGSVDYSKYDEELIKDFNATIEEKELEL